MGAESELLQVAERAARAAGAELLQRFGQAPVDLQTKTTPTDPVSAADLAAEQLIRDLLATERPDDAILGEEGGETAAGANGLRWVVDPLDGTVNFLYGIPAFCVSVACEDSTGALAGAVFEPVAAKLYAATRSGAVTRNGVPVTASRCDTLKRALVATGFAYDAAVRAKQAEVLLKVLPTVRDIRRGGSAALDLAACACGEVDAYYERGVKPWDIAAGALLCARAGLEVRMLAAVPEQGLPSGIAVAPRALIGPLLELVG